MANLKQLVDRYSIAVNIASSALTNLNVEVRRQLGDEWYYEHFESDGVKLMYCGRGCTLSVEQAKSLINKHGLEKAVEIIDWVY